MRTITLEEHFATPAFLDGPLKELKERRHAARAAKLIAQLCDLGEGRIAEMDAAGIDMQVVSLTAPGVEQMEAADAIAMARDTNDVLAAAIKSHPARISGFASAPDRELRTRRRRSWSAARAAEIRRRGDQRPQPRPLSRRQILLADPGVRRNA